MDLIPDVVISFLNDNHKGALMTVTNYQACFMPCCRHYKLLEDLALDGAITYDESLCLIDIVILRSGVMVFNYAALPDAIISFLDVGCYAFWCGELCQ